MAILYRTNGQAKGLEMALRECQIKYKTFGGQSFFERKETKDFLSYLRLCVKPSDNLALWRIINTPARGLGLKTQEYIQEVARDKNTSPYLAMKKGMVTFNKKTNASILAFISTIETLRNSILSQKIDLEQICKKIIEDFSLIDHIRKTYKDSETQHNKINNVKAIPLWLEQSYQSFLKENKNISIKDFLEKNYFKRTTFTSRRRKRK